MSIEGIDFAVAKLLNGRPKPMTEMARRSNEKLK